VGQISLNITTRGIAKLKKCIVFFIGGEEGNTNVRGNHKLKTLDLFGILNVP
jgi:hypothetical protein